MPSQHTTAIIVTYHSDSVLLQCIAALKDVGEIIVIDNGGTTPIPNVTFIKNKKNLGFGRANNRALGKVKTPYALLINPDAVLQENALALLLETLERNPDAALVSPLLNEEEGAHRRSWRVTGERKPTTTPKQCFAVDYNPAAVWLMRADALRNIGGFDKRFFLFYEDNDVCVRLKKAGYSLIVEPRAVAIHAQGKSSPPTFKTRCIKHAQTSYSALYFAQKHYGKRAALKRAVSIFINCIGRLLRGDFTAAVARIAGLLKFLFVKFFTNHNFLAAIFFAPFVGIA